MSEPMIPPPPPPAGPQASNRPTTALILGIVGLICCPICGPFAWYMGAQEGKAIRQGQSPVAGQGLATAGMVLGILGTVELAIFLCWILFLGGMTMISAFSAAAGN